MTFAIDLKEKKQEEREQKKEEQEKEDKGKDEEREKNGSFGENAVALPSLMLIEIC